VGESHYSASSSSFFLTLPSTSSMSPQCGRSPGLFIKEVWLLAGSPPCVTSAAGTRTSFRYPLLRTHHPKALRRVFQTQTASSSIGSSSSCSSSSLNHRPPRAALHSLSPFRSLRSRRSLVPVIMTTQTRSHAAGHSHHHHHDNVYLTSSNKNDAGVRITRIGLYSNLGMAFGKFAGGYFFNSQSMIADAWHSLTDLASDILTLATVSWSLKPPTDSFPTGFGKIESLGSLGVSGMLLGGGIFMCWSSLETLYSHFFLDPSVAAEIAAHGHSHGHGHGHGHAVGVPSLHAAWLAAGTVLIKEWLYHASRWCSPFMPWAIANGFHQQ
jgi:hypothetical protein